jgi:hypothetical protein
MQYAKGLFQPIVNLLLSGVKLKIWLFLIYSFFTAFSFLGTYQLLYGSQRGRRGTA